MGAYLFGFNCFHGALSVFATRSYQIFIAPQLPGLGYLYSGLARRKNALSMLFLSLVSLGIVSFQWFFIGYSLVFSETGGSFWGDGRSVSVFTLKTVVMLTQAYHRNIGFRQVLERPIPEANGKLPEIVFATFQLVSHAV